MKKIYFFLLIVFVSNFEVRSQSFCSFESKTIDPKDYILNRLIPSNKQFYQSSYLQGGKSIMKFNQKKYLENYGFGGSVIDLTGLANFDSYPTSGVGFELGVTQIFPIGISFNANIGGSSNDWLWVGVSGGYTHGFYRWAPYGRVGLAATFEDFEAGVAGYFEMGSYFRLTSWLSVKPSMRFVYVRPESQWQTRNYNLFMVSFSIDPFKLIPYTAN
jgi:hypothetical protein